MTSGCAMISAGLSLMINESWEDISLRGLHTKRISVLLSLIMALVLTLTGCVDASYVSPLIESGPVITSAAPSIGFTCDSLTAESQTMGSDASATTTTIASVSAAATTAAALDIDGRYTTKDDIAAYLHMFQQLPPNFITKNEAIKLGWDSDRGNLWDVTDELSIGGDIFSNREGLLPKKSGRVWHECDVNYQGGFRGPERIVYSNDGLIYFTEDHYQSFTQLY